MKVEYDKYYQTKNLFGKPYPELISFYSKLKKKGRLLDVGCGQGRDAIPLAKMGFQTTGIDISTVGIMQLNAIAKQEKLPLVGTVADIYNYSNYGEFEFILLDSIFHFGKKEYSKEIDLFNNIVAQANPKTIITICIQKTTKKLKTIDYLISSIKHLNIIHRSELIYTYKNNESNHSSSSVYEMLSIKKTS